MIKIENVELFKSIYKNDIICLSVIVDVSSFQSKISIILYKYKSK